MEYGLMLGFNKYVVPFQRDSQKLPFNVAGLDTIKYSRADFERQAAEALDAAIAATQQEVADPDESAEQYLDPFLLTRKALVTTLESESDRVISRLGTPLGFRLLNDFSGLRYMFLGTFTSLRPEVAAWRVRMLAEILDETSSTRKKRVDWGLATRELPGVFETLIAGMRIWVVVTGDADREAVVTACEGVPYEFEVFTVADIRAGVEDLS
jgi:hypothetical protein